MAFPHDYWVFQFKCTYDLVLLIHNSYLCIEWLVFTEYSLMHKAMLWFLHDQLVSLAYILKIVYKKYLLTCQESTSHTPRKILDSKSSNPTFLFWNYYRCWNLFFQFRRKIRLKTKVLLKNTNWLGPLT